MENCWSDDLDSKLAFLLECLPDKDPTHLMDVLNKNQGSVDLSLQALMVEDQSDDQLAILIDAFPDCEAKYLEQKLDECNGNVDAVMDMLISGGAKKSKKQVVEVPVVFKDSPVKTQDSVTDVDEPSSSRPANIQRQDIVPGAAETYRDIASNYAKQRNDMFARAATEFKKGRYGRVVASYYAEKGRDLNSKMVRENWHAVESLLQDQKRKGGSNSIDLHYMTTEEAVAVLKEELEEWKKRNHHARSIGEPSSPLQVITGKGKYRLYERVHTYLSKNNYVYEAADGYFVVKFTS